ncbi:MAG: hypothetical protein KDK70_35395, partial [Myxococcales bacterium]|nr:hypothetical protein [Myxococcales bacterium]
MIDPFVALPLPLLERLHDAVRNGRLAVPPAEPGLMAERLEALRPHLPLLRTFSSAPALGAFLEAVVGLR